MANPLHLDNAAGRRIWLGIFGTALIVASFLTPWWTRGVNITGEAGEEIPGAEGLYLHYGPFSTPGGPNISTDGSRETIVGVLGILMVVSALLLTANIVIRILRARGRVECSSNLPVALCIGSFAFGVTAVLTGALFVPLMGQEPGFLWGEEGENADEVAEASDGEIEFTRYANAGFYFGILAFVAYPIYAWVDAAAARQREETWEAQEASARRTTTGRTA